LLKKVYDLDDNHPELGDELTVTEIQKQLNRLVVSILPPLHADIYSPYIPCYSRIIPKPLYRLIRFSTLSSNFLANS
jgi:hypothetical protein